MCDNLENGLREVIVFKRKYYNILTVKGLDYK